MSTDLKAIMARDERRRQMLNDPDLTGNLLLLVLAMDEVITVRREQGRKRFKGSWVTAIEEMVCRKRSGWMQGWWVKNQIGDDVPRYEPQESSGRRCVAPMIRREGECGKTGSLGMTDRDPLTGEARRIWLCARHRGLQAQFDARVKEWQRNGRPSPPPNTGGVLRRYFVFDDDLYRWAAPYREPMEGGREATPPRPKLRLIQGGEDVENEEVP